MSKEAMKLALEALETAWTYDEDNADGYYLEAITALREALAEQPAQQKPVNLRRGDLLRCIETDELCTVWATSTTGNTLIKWSANNFGDYTAEQIGELFWLEPAQQEPMSDHRLMEQPAQQEPVAKDNNNYRFDPPGLDPSHQKPVAWWIPKAKQFCLPSSDGTRPFAKAWEPLYTSPPAQRTWVGLTEEERNDLEDYCEMIIGKAAFDAIEDKLKEKNT